MPLFKTDPALQPIVDPQYRYKLRRDLLIGEGTVVWVMLNPSTADDVKDDQTIGSVKRISANHGYRRIIVVNVFAVRTTYPAQLKVMNEQHLIFGDKYDIDVWGGRKNKEALLEAFSEADDVVVAWGNFDFRPFYDEPADTLSLVHGAGFKPLCCGTNKNGSPRHPCRLPGNTKLVRY